MFDTPSTPDAAASSSPRLRIFVSSPGDVDTERKIAERVVARLAGEFSGRLGLEAYFWEAEPMRQQATFQDQIPSTAEFDVVLCILWSRLGTPLTGPDGKVYPSGTDYEVESAREAFARSGRPELMIYLNQTPAQVRQLPREEREKMMRQLDALEDFVARHCVDRQSGVIKGAFTSYRDLGQFEDLLEKHLRKFIAARLPAGQENATDAPRAAGVTWPGRPYQGLRAFDYEHAPIFFGRTRATGEVLALLRQRAVRLEEARAAAVGGGGDIDPAAATFVLVCAMSGVGKSSLVRAGVLPLLTQPGGGIGVWRRVVLRPSETPAGGDLFDALAQALTRPDGLPELLGRGGTSVTPQQIAFELRRQPAGADALAGKGLTMAAESAFAVEKDGLRDEARRLNEGGRVHDVERLEVQLAALAPPAARLAVVIDQMEELFTLDQVTPEVRRKFIQALGALARHGWVYVIGTLRSDFFARCSEVSEWMDLQQHGIYHLKPPTAEELGQMIRRPAQAAGLAFARQPGTETPLDESLRDAAARSPEALPLLEFALDALYERRDANRLTWTAYDEIGGLEGALAAAAEEALGKLRTWQQETFDHVMGGLVTLGTGTNEQTAHRRTADYEALTRPPGARAFVDAFVAARLFVADQDTAGHAIVSVAHEALLGRRHAPAASAGVAATTDELPADATRPWQWARLGEWVEANADFLRMRARLTASLKQWQDAGRDAGFLLPAGRPLLDGETLAREHPQALSTEERDYIARSVTAETGRRRRLARVRAAVMAGLALLAVGAGIGAWFGYRGEHEAEDQTRIAQQKTVEAEQQAGIARQKTVEANTQTEAAHKTADQMQAQLRQASLADLATAKSLFAKGQWREGVAYLGRALVDDPANAAAQAWLWSKVVYETGDRVPLPQRVFSDPGKILDQAYTADGRRVLGLCGDKIIRQWDRATGQPIGVPIACAWASKVTYSPDGTRIAAIVDGRSVRQWDANTGQPSGPSIELPNPDAEKYPETRVSVSSLTYSPDGSRLLAAAEWNLWQWDAHTGKPVGQSMNFKCMVHHAAYSPDGKRYVTAADNGFAQQWDAGTGQPVGKTMQHDGIVVDDAEYSPDGTRIVTASRQAGDAAVAGAQRNTLQQWDAATGEKIGQPLHHVHPMVHAVYSPDGLRILTTHEVGNAGLEVREWVAASNAVIGAPLPVTCAAYLPGGGGLALIRADLAIGEYDLATEAPGGESLGPEAICTRAAYHPAGTRLVVAGKAKDSVLQLDADTGEPVGEAMFHPCLVVGGNFGTIAYNGDGTRIVTANGDRTARQWDAATGRPADAVLKHEEIVSSAAYSPDGTRIVTSSGFGVIQQWEAATGRLIGELAGGNATGGGGVAYSADGRRILAERYLREGSVVQQWDAGTGAAVGPPLSFPDGVLCSAVYRADGRMIFTITQTKENLVCYFQQWDALTGQPAGQPLELVRNFQGVAYSPDGLRLCILSPFDRDGILMQQWDIAAGRPLGPPVPCKLPIRQIYYDPRGTRLLTCIANRPAQQWECNPPGGPPPAWLDNFIQALTGLHFDENGELGELSTAQRLAALAALRARLAALAPESAGDWERLGRWAISSSPERPYTPASTRSTLAIAARQLTGESEDAFTEALCLNPNTPLQRLALAGCSSYGDEPTRADFLRRYELARLPADDPALLSCAAAMLLSQDVYGLALETAQKLLALDSTRTDALRVIAISLDKLDRHSEALAAYEKLLARPNPTRDDCERAAYAAARLGHADRAREMLRQAASKPPGEPGSFCFEGWVLVNINAPAEARAAFQRDEAASQAAGFKPSIETVAGLAVSEWLAGDKDAAVRDFQRLIADDPDRWIDTAGIKADSAWTETEKNALLAVQAETLRRHPELAPKPKKNH